MIETLNRTFRTTVPKTPNLAFKAKEIAPGESNVVYGPIEHAKARDFDTIWGVRRHIRGLIDYAFMVDRSYGTEYLRRFEAICWP